MPLILTMPLDAVSQAGFNQLRARYFPPERNFIDAHVTLFHHLPDAEREAIGVTLRATAAEQPVIAVKVTGLRNLGCGVAYTLHAPELTALRSRLADQWRGWLTPQDQQKFQPHITVQNKVTPRNARETLAILETEPQSASMTGVGLTLWEYLGGPWAQVENFPFGCALAGRD